MEEEVKCVSKWGKRLCETKIPVLFVLPSALSLFQCCVCFPITPSPVIILCRVLPELAWQRWPRLARPVPEELWQPQAT